MDIFIDYREASRMYNVEFFPAIGDYRGAFKQRYHTVKTSQLLDHADEVLEITVIDFDKPKIVNFTHGFSRSVMDTSRVSRSRLFADGRHVWAVEYTDIAASIEAAGLNTPRFVFRIPASKFSGSPHFGQYIAAGKNIDDTLFLAILPYDRITDDGYPMVNPPSHTPREDGMIVIYGPTPSCGVKIPGGRI